MLKAFAEKLGIDSYPESITTLDQLMDWYNNKESEKIITNEIGTSFINLNHSDRASNFRQEMESRINDASDLMRRAHSRLIDAHQARLSMMRELCARHDDVTAELNKILADRFFSFKSYNKHNNTLYFLTPNITLKHNDLRVDMGSFEIALSPTKITIYPHENNITSNGYIHPHVSSSNVVCWGTAQEIYSKGLINLEFSRVMIALQAILTQYNPDSPYCELYRFAIKRGTLDLSQFVFEWHEMDDRSDSFLSDEFPDDINWNTVRGTGDWTEAADEDEESQEYMRADLFCRYYKEIDFLDEENVFYKTTKGEYKPWEL